MLRPGDGLTGLTIRRLDAATALGAQETWVDRDALHLAEPSRLGRWLCVLEWPSSPLLATGSADACTDLAARHALERFDRLMALVVPATGIPAGLTMPQFDEGRRCPDVYCGASA